MTGDRREVDSTAGPMARPARHLAALVVSLVVLAPHAGLAQRPPDVTPDPRFDVVRIEVAGNTLLTPAEIDRLVAPHTGRGKDFADVQKVLEILEQAYRERGYGIVQVLLPEQDITRGVVRYRVIEPRLRQITIEGNVHFSRNNVRRSLPSVAAGRTPNLGDIARNLRMLDDHPVKQTNVLLRSGRSERELDAAVRIADDKPWRAFFSLDNTGTGEAGPVRSAFGLQHANLFDRDHVLTARYVTSPTHPGEVNMLGGAYRVAFYGLNATLDLLAGYSNADSGVIPGLYEVTASGMLAGVRWTHFLPGWREIDQRVILGLDYRAYRDENPERGRTRTPDVTVHPVSAGYHGLWRATSTELAFQGTGAVNVPGGRDGQAGDFGDSRPGAHEHYSLLRYGLDYTKRFRGEWRVRVGIRGQYTDDSLVAGEQFGIGGPDSVRGYPLRDVAGDRGVSSQIEALTPDIARRAGYGGALAAQLLVFFDWGGIRRNNWRPGDGARRDTIASAGFGLRMTYGKTAQLRLDAAQILQETASRAGGSRRVTGTLALSY